LFSICGSHPFACSLEFACNTGHNSKPRDQPYPLEKADRIAQLIIKKIDKRELQEVTQMDDTERGEQGFGSSTTTMDPEVKGRKAKPKVEINEISAKAFGQLYRRGETTSVL